MARKAIFPAISDISVSGASNMAIVGALRKTTRECSSTFSYKSSPASQCRPLSAKM